MEMEVVAVEELQSLSVSVSQHGLTEKAAVRLGGGGLHWQWKDSHAYLHLFTT